MEWKCPTDGLVAGGRDGDELPEAAVATAICHLYDGRISVEEYRERLLNSTKKDPRARTLTGAKRRGARGLF